MGNAQRANACPCGYGCAAPAELNVYVDGSFITMAGAVPPMPAALPPVPAGDPPMPVPLPPPAPVCSPPPSPPVLFEPGKACAHAASDRQATKVKQRALKLSSISVLRG